MPTPLEILLDPVSLAVLAIYMILMIWEALFPARQLPKIKFWKVRGLTAFAFFFYLSSYLPLFTDPYLEPYRLFDLTGLGALGGGLLGVLLYEFGVYVWHRALHTSNFLWRTFHQMHHSAERLDTYGAFYFSPMDMIGWTVLGSVCFALLVGLSPQAITVTLLVTNFLGMFQHANIKTPRWLGYIVQRPESHTVHHAKGIHKHNYSDLPVFDILFGTFQNPKDYEHPTGFYYGASAKVLQMLSFKDLNREREEKKRKRLEKNRVSKVLGLLVLVCFALGCSKDDGIEVVPDPVQENLEPESQPETPTSSIDEVTPLRGPKGTLVTITGANFGTDLENVKVTFNRKAASILKLEDTLIEVEVPAGALSGNIQVNTANSALLAAVFTYEFTTEVSTLAGEDKGLADGTLAEAKFASPMDVVMDSQGNMYIADSENHRIRRVTPQGVVSTFAGGTQGYNDGPALTAQFDHPMGLAIDLQGNLYVADNWNHKIRKITPDGSVGTIAGIGPGLEDGLTDKALFKFPRDIVVDAQGTIYVADTGNHRIRKIVDTPGDFLVSTLAGSSKGHADGVGTAAKFFRPTGIVMFDSGRLLVADTENHRIRILTLDGATGTLTGSDPGFADGTQEEAKFLFPSYLVSDGAGSFYISDTFNHKVRKLAPDGTVSTVAGNTFGLVDGKAENAKFHTPLGLTVDAEGAIYVIDNGNHRIRKIEDN
ncbi:sterol desaturase family protein [Flavobacteriaceae bacterium 3-367]